MEYKWRQELHRCMCKTHLADPPREVEGRGAAQGEVPSAEVTCRQRGQPGRHKAHLPSQLRGLWFSSKFPGKQRSFLWQLREEERRCTNSEGGKAHQQRCPALFALLPRLFDIPRSFSAPSPLQLFPCQCGTDSTGW